MSNIVLLRLIGLLEGVSYLALLGICMPLKYMVDTPEPTRFVGMAHGVLFIIYCFLVLVVRSERGWGVSVTFLVLLAAIVPFGPFVADVKLFRVNTGSAGT